MINFGAVCIYSFIRFLNLSDFKNLTGLEI